MQLPGTRSDEHFFFSKVRPRCLYITLLLVRLAVWFPYPFISLVIGKLWGAPRGLQIYLGIKADGTQSHKYSTWVMVLTLKELAAFRIHTVDSKPDPYNMGGF